MDIVKFLQFFLSYWTLLSILYEANWYLKAWQAITLKCDRQTHGWIDKHKTDPQTRDGQLMLICQSAYVTRKVLEWNNGYYCIWDFHRHALGSVETATHSTTEVVYFSFFIATLNVQCNSYKSKF